MTSLKNLEKRIKKIEKRNKRVEKGKDWETSNTRRVTISIFTYLALALYMQAIEIEKPWLNAIIPTVGFLLSTLTLPYFRILWEKYIRK